MSNVYIRLASYSPVRGVTYPPAGFGLALTQRRACRTAGSNTLKIKKKREEKNGPFSEKLVQNKQNNNVCLFTLKEILCVLCFYACACVRACV